MLRGVNTLSRICATGIRTAHSSAALDQNTQRALALIRDQPSQYVVASVAGRKYLLSPRDLLTVPRLKDVRVGDKLRLSDIHELGSRDYTLRGNPVIPGGAVNLDATVVEHTKGQMEVIVKFKKRKGYRKTVTHKQTYTRLRIGDIEIPAIQQPSP
ncbi:hypothetical protein PUNSTDRAFT_90778 [Punctularia strigosozonata HHB-11173 SS5]|uniref:uncharacterized protein n=1 Tax=Punctularia strigosozonata (strain HHB-11173) TaxID=741275 RepID=UPI00044165E7|nr:uncharacterized protein PUNSTDRAFT_90778 [Punctularia strigosozonata HHB-11173 SS5]EIN06034.1 hypothetical protein PUNSTDRAFT_90778 [Punctularia strigosozonata HHB-11173 SS5]